MKCDCSHSSWNKGAIYSRLLHNRSIKLSALADHNVHALQWISDEQNWSEQCRYTLQHQIFVQTQPDLNLHIQVWTGNFSNVCQAQVGVGGLGGFGQDINNEDKSLKTMILKDINW